MTALRELAERWKAEADIAEAKGNMFNGGMILTKRACADELLNILDAEGDAGAVSDEDAKWLAHIRKELFWRLDMAKSRDAVNNANARINAFDRLMDGANSLPAVDGVDKRDAERLDWLQRVSKTSTVYMNNQHPWNMAGNLRLRDLRGPTLRVAIDAAIKGQSND